MATVRREREEDLGAVREAVFNGLKAYNEAKVGPRDTKPLALSLRDDAGAFVGGLVGELKWNWLHVDMLWIDESQRRSGHGQALLTAAEEIAREHGATGVYVSTGSIQAPGFYAKLGYREYGRLQDYPVAGECMHYLTKTL